MEILKKLLSLPSVSGSEEKYSESIKEILSEYCDEVFADITGNTFGIRRVKNPKKKILIDAHSDIIGRMVASVKKDGLISFVCVGGVDTRILPSMAVTIHGKKDIRGIIGVPPPHLNTDGENEPYKVENLCVDTGFTAEELEGIVETGDFISFDSDFTELLNGRIASRGLDNKAGVYAAIKVLEKLTTDTVEVTVGCTSGEEINLNGARVAGNLDEFDLCIVIDVTHGTTPDSKEQITYPLGSGASIAVGPGLSKKYTSEITDFAGRNNIPHTVEVTSGSTGTNSMAYSVLGAGIPCVVVSVPLRYMHTSFEVADISDINAVAELVSSYADSLGEE